jgi:hypothetical protein
MMFKTELNKETLSLLIKTIEKQSDISFIEHTLEWCYANEFSVTELISTYAGQVPEDVAFDVGRTYEPQDGENVTVEIVDYNPLKTWKKYFVHIVEGDRTPLDMWVSEHDIDEILERANY